MCLLTLKTIWQTVDHHCHVGLINETCVKIEHNCLTFDTATKPIPSHHDQCFRTMSHRTGVQHSTILTSTPLCHLYIKVNNSSYIAQYPVHSMYRSALHSIPWQTCSMDQHIDFSVSHSGMLHLCAKTVRTSYAYPHS